MAEEFERVADRRTDKRFAVRRLIAAAPIPADEWEAVEDLLAELVARAYIADHPEVLARGVGERLSAAAGLNVHPPRAPQRQEARRDRRTEDSSFSAPESA